MRMSVVLMLAAAVGGWAAEPFLQSELVFPLEKWHNHASSIVELPNRDLFVVWYNGSGERTADDVKIEGAYKKRGAKQWGARFTVADTPGFPDCNPALFVDSQKKLWMFWPLIVSNQWETAVLKYRVSSKFANGKPVWDWNDDLFFAPRNFAEKAKDHPKAKDKFLSRVGWMPRVHAYELPSGRMLLPLYSDGYDFSLVAITDDHGKTWTSSEPMLGAGNVQPSIVRKKDGTLVAYFRDNGPRPKRVMKSESKDDGITWTRTEDTEMFNPGSGLEVIVLKTGEWVMINNDTEKGRGSLVLTVSDDEGKTWKWQRHMEKDDKGSFHYPSLIQASDGTLHASYSLFRNDVPEGQPRKAIKHAHFNLEWVKKGD